MATKLVLEFQRCSECLEVFSVAELIECPCGADVCTTCFQLEWHEPHVDAKTTAAAFKKLHDAVEGLWRALL